MPFPLIASVTCCLEEMSEKFEVRLSKNRGANVLKNLLETVFR